MCSAICPASRFACHATCRCRCVFCCAVCVRGNLLLLSTRQRSKLLMLRIGAGALLVPRLPCLRVQLHEVPLSTPRSCRRPAVPTMCVYDAMHQSCAPTSTVQSNACPTKHAMYACMHATAGTTWNIRAGLNIWIAVDVFFFFFVPCIGWGPSDPHAVDSIVSGDVNTAVPVTLDTAPMG